MQSLTSSACFQFFLDDCLIVALLRSPGIVDTDMGKAGAASVGLTTEQLGAITPLASVEGILNVVDVATKATHGGKFWSYTGEELTY